MNQTLRVIVARFSRQAVAGGSARFAPQTAQALLDGKHLAQLTEALGKEKVGTLIDDFVAEMDEAIGTISASLEAGRIDETLKAQAHSAAGSSALFGAVVLRKELVALEERIRDGEEQDEGLGALLRETWVMTSRELRQQKVDG